MDAYAIVKLLYMCNHAGEQKDKHDCNIYVHQKINNNYWKIIKSCINKKMTDQNK